MPFIETCVPSIVEVNWLAVPVGLLFTGLIVRTILGAAIVVVLLLWKLSKLVDAYTEKLKAK